MVRMQYIIAYFSVEMRTRMAIFAVLLCCVLCFDDWIITLLTSSRALLVWGLLCWLRCEWYVCGGPRKAASHRAGEGPVIKENYELSQAVMRLSDQHRLLCEIRNAALRAAKCSRDALVELKFSGSSEAVSSSSPSEFMLSPECKPDVNAERLCPASPLRPPASPLRPPIVSVENVKKLFRKGSMSENGLSSYAERHAGSFTYSEKSL